ncbi:MAG: hypothetical protein AAB482_02375 [Patescibacteria group bacterium]
MEAGKEFEPLVFNTHNHRLRGHFENYSGKKEFENGEPEFDEIRQEIAKHFGVPFVEENEDELSKQDEGHIFIIDNKLVPNQRHYRAFCVVVREKDGKRDAWYIDGRMPHATMLLRLYNHYGVSEEDRNEVSLGFLDDEGFPNIPEIQEKAEEQKKPIRWFIRETVSPTKE